MECFTRPTSYYLADLYLLLSFVILFAWVGLDSNVWWAVIPALGAFAVLLFRIDAALESIYPSYFALVPDALRHYRGDFRLIRFLKFREKLLDSGFSQEAVSACLPLTQKEHELTEFQSIASRPHVLWLLTLLGGLIAGTSSMDVAWKKGIAPVLILLVAISLGYAFLFADLFRPRRFAEKEFELFLHWFCNEVVP